MDAVHLLGSAISAGQKIHIETLASKSTIQVPTSVSFVSIGVARFDSVGVFQTAKYEQTVGSVSFDHGELPIIVPRGSNFQIYYTYRVGSEYNYSGIFDASSKLTCSGDSNLYPWVMWLEG